MAKQFSVGEIARTMDVSERSILRRIQHGELAAQQTRSGWKVSQPALKQWIFYALGIGVPQRLYTVLVQNGIKLDKKVRQERRASGFKHGGTRTEVATWGVLLTPEAAVIEMQRSFRYLAWRLARKDPGLRDDLAQEMSLAVLRCGRPATRFYFFQRARSRALNYRQYERRRGMKLLRNANKVRATDGSIRNEDLMRLLVLAGIPVATLEKELGISICPDFELDARTVPFPDESELDQPLELLIDQPQKQGSQWRIANAERPGGNGQVA